MGATSEVEEISGTQVNVATWKVNISDISGGNAWGDKHRPEECSIIIDTGFNDGGLRTHARLRKYVEYLKIFYPKATISKTNGGIFKICVLGSRTT